MNLIISVFIVYFIITLSSMIQLFFTHNRGDKIPVLQISLLLLIDTVSFILLHILQYLWIRLLIKQGFLKKNIMILGKPDKRLPFPGFMAEIKKTGILVGEMTANGKTWLFQNNRDMIREYSFSELKDVIASNIVGEIIIFMGKELSGEKLYRIVSYCRENSINYYVVPEMKRLPNKGFWKRYFNYIPFLDQWKSMRDSLTFITCKRLSDLFLVILASAVLIPLSIVIACAIKLNDGGPVFHISKRVGKNGKIINFIKFRSMVMNAEKLKKDILHMNQRKDGPLFKVQNDPRTTRIGKFLRKFSLDEIPQFLNVLKGELSLIGPRPHLVEEVKKYSKMDKLRLECLPGIIGLPQMYGNDFTGFREIVDLDLHYRKNWSIFLDMKILALGFKYMLFPFLSR